MSPAQHDQVIGALVIFIIGFLTVLSTLVAGAGAWLLSRIKATEKVADTAHENIVNLSNGKGVEKIQAVITEGIANGRIGEGKLVPQGFPITPLSDGVVEVVKPTTETTQTNGERDTK